MLDTIPVPADSKFGAMVARRLNASRPIAPAGSLAMSGPTGTGFAAPPTNLRDRRGLSAPSPRQFTLRAEVETKHDEPEQKRLVVKMCDFCDDAVRWNHVNIPQGGTITELENGFREIYVGDWSDELSESKTFYLNLKIEFDYEGGLTTGHPFITTFSEWTVEDEPLEERFDFAGCRMFASFPIGHVLAGATGAFVRQYFDGSQNFVDLSWWAYPSSGGGSGKDVDGTEYPMPFQFNDGKIKNNIFYFDGTLLHLPDFNAPEDGYVYLVVTEDSNHNLTFRLDLNQGSAPEGGDVTNYLVYGFTGGKVSMDFRTTFLALFKKGLSVNEESGLEIVGRAIDWADRSEDDSFGIRTLTVSGATGAVKAKYKVIGTEDVELSDLDEDDIEDLKKAVKSECVESVNSAKGDVSIIGGVGVRVGTSGKVITITADASKEEADDRPEASRNPCDHPGNEEQNDSDGDGGVTMSGIGADDGGGGGGCSACGGMSTTGGSGTGSPEHGVSGKPAEGAAGGGASAPGKEVTTPPSSGSSGTASGSPGKEIRPGSMEATAANAKTPIYTGTHNALTDTKKMNTSPFAQDPNWTGGIGHTGRETSPIYTGTHTALTDTKKMNESPFKKASK